MKIKNLNMYMNILKIVLVAVGVIACFALFGGPNTNAEDQAILDFRESGKMGFATMFTGFIFFLGLGLILAFFVVQLITNPKRTIISILGLLAALVIYLIISMMGTADTNETLQLRNPVSQGTISSTTAGLWTVLVALIIGLLAVLSSFLMRRIK